jgi:hypothetical protein
MLWNAECQELPMAELPMAVLEYVATESGSAQFVGLHLATGQSCPKSPSQGHLCTNLQLSRSAKRKWRFRWSHASLLKGLRAAVGLEPTTYGL